MLELSESKAKALQIFKDAKEGKSHIIVPAVVIAETMKQLLHRGKKRAGVELFFDSIEQSEKIRIISVDKAIAMEGAVISLSYGVPLVDSLVAATAHIHQCDMLLAKDAHYTPFVKKKYIKLHNW